MIFIYRKLKKKKKNRNSKDVLVEDNCEFFNRSIDSGKFLGGVFKETLRFITLTHYCENRTGFHSVLQNYTV